MASAVMDGKWVQPGNKVRPLLVAGLAPSVVLRAAFRVVTKNLVTTVNQEVLLLFATRVVSRTLPVPIIVFV